MEIFLIDCIFKILNSLSVRFCLCLKNCTRQLIKKVNLDSKICRKSVMKRNHYFLNIQLTPDNSNPKLAPRANSNKVDFPWIWFTVILPSLTRTLDNSNLPLSRSNFCFPSAHFCTISPSIYSNHVISAWQVG